MKLDIELALVALAGGVIYLGTIALFIALNVPRLNF